MGRGLGERQREVLDRLAAEPPGEWVPLHRLVDDPGDSTELARCRSAVHGLERRGLVVTSRMADPNRMVNTTTVRGYFDDRTGRMAYEAEEAERQWFGLHVMLAGYRDPDDLPMAHRRLRRVVGEDATAVAVSEP